ncbi:MAG: MBL fold metallo-hydrolase [Gemmatimonadota bacterium]
MTVLYVLGSGSKGNCAAVRHEGQTILLDAGFSAREIGRRARDVGLPLDSVIAIALTHEHGDHTAGAASLARQLNVPVIASTGTWDRLRPKFAASRFIPAVLMGEVSVGPFRVRCCAVSHDAAEPIAIRVETPDGVSLALATDVGRTTTALRWLMAGVHALVLEANHDEVLLRTSRYPASVQERIVGSGGHLSNRAAAELLGELMHPGLRLVVLAHLSERCNTADEARRTIGPVLEAAGFQGGFEVALQHRPLHPLSIAG